MPLVPSALASLLVTGLALAHPPHESQRPAPSRPSRPAAVAVAVPSLGSLFASDSPTFTVDDSFIAAALAVQGQLSLSVVLGSGETVTLALEPFEAVEDDAVVAVGHSAKATTSAALGERLRGVKHLRGEVVGEPGSLAYLAVGSTGATGFIDRAPGHGRFVVRRADGESRGLMKGLLRFDAAGGTSQPEVPLCGATDDGHGGIAGLGAVPPGVTPRIEIAVDSDHEFYAIFNDETAATEYIAALYGAISAVYRRDTDAVISISYVRLATDPDDLFNDPDPLYQFRDWWNANMADVHRDVAQLLTGRRNLPYGGVAWLNATCGDFGYSVNGYLIGAFGDPYVPSPGNWDLIVVAHELGHNVGSQHTHWYGLDNCDSGDVQRGSIMSYCHTNSGATANIEMRFHRVCADAIESFLIDSPCIGSDCDDDGIEDADAIAGGLVADTNSDGIPDACQDCDGDGVLDPVAIASGAVEDLDGDGRPDACEPDCNGNGVPDSLDIALGTSTDAFGDGVPDECEPDCNGNGIADYTDIQSNMAIDKGRDAIIDTCQDCDADGVSDFAELLGSASIWVGSADVNEVRELHPRSGVVVNVIPLEAPVYDLAIGSDGYLYASAGRSIWRIDRETRTVVKKVIDFGSPLQARGLSFRADGVLVAATSAGTIYLLDVATDSLVGSFSAPGTIDARDAYVRPNGNILVSYAAHVVRQFGPSGAPLGVFTSLPSLEGDLMGIFELPDNGGVLVTSKAQRALLRFDATTGAFLGRFDVQASNLFAAPWGLAPSADGRAVIATSATSSSTVNGYNLESGYLERTYRVYGADAPGATAVVVAPFSATDTNGNLIPDECEGMLGDLNGDGLVNGADLGTLLGAWGSAAADLNGDGTTDGADLAILLGNWS